MELVQQAEAVEAGLLQPGQVIRGQVAAGRKPPPEKTSRKISTATDP